MTTNAKTQCIRNWHSFPMPLRMTGRIVTCECSLVDYVSDGQELSVKWKRPEPPQAGKKGEA